MPAAAGDAPSLETLSAAEAELAALKAQGIEILSARNARLMEEITRLRAEAAGAGPTVNAAEAAAAAAMLAEFQQAAPKGVWDPAVTAEEFAAQVKRAPMLGTLVARDTQHWNATQTSMREMQVGQRGGGPRARARARARHRRTAAAHAAVPQQGREPRDGARRHEAAHRGVGV